jgi:hypothetical protein|tara:strand:- start:10612 stop:13074 length:2463 start_codon:yes stop_codon:yes gene_type:complete
VGGPTEQTTNTIFIPPGEGRQAFAPSPLAWLVENMELGSEGTLESVVGPSILRIKAQVFDGDADLDLDNPTFTPTLPDFSPAYGYKSGIPFSIYSSSLLRGGARTLLYRIGDRLYRFKGSHADADEVLISGISVNPESRNLDQYVTIGDKIIYYNGIDQAQVITYDGMVVPLGFDVPASVPGVSSPSQPDYDEITNYYPNSRGYSWQGRIGTPGDELSGQKASLLKGAWYYYFQYEDIHGNLSEFSGPSDPATVHTNQADPISVIGIANKAGAATGVSTLVGQVLTAGASIAPKALPLGTEIDDLTRRFLVKATGDLPEHAVATRIFRTADTFHKDSVPKFLARVPGSGQFVFDDNHSDSELGFDWTETVSVPVFRTACSHKGRLIIGNVAGDPGIVRQSQPGFPGTFEESDYIYPDSNGLEITALRSHNGNLLAFTESSIYLIGDDFASYSPVSIGIGCVAPKSIQSLRDGSLVWLGADGFYGMSVSGQIAKISVPIQKIMDQETNKSQFFRAVSVVDYDSGEYRCALAKKGESRNQLIVCYADGFWRRMDYGIDIADMCSQEDHEHKTLFVGSDPREDTIYSGRKFFNMSRVFIMGRQSTDYFGPPRRVRYRSTWMRSGDFGLVPTNVRNLYVGMLDAWVGTATVRLYRNGSWNPIAEMNDVLLHGPDDESGIVDQVASKAVLSKSKARHSRVFWRQIPVDIQNANSWAFEIEITGSPAPLATRGIRDGTIRKLAGPILEAPAFYAEKAMLSASKEFDAWRKVYSQMSTKEFSELFSSIKSRPMDWELGRLKIHAFAFDVSIATQGTPLGRVPFRQDK